MQRRLRVLLSAYACEPGEGSEPGVGWNWVCEVARYCDVWVLTRANNRPAIERALDEEHLRRVSWVYFDLPRWLCFWKKGQRGIHLYYYLWQIGAFFLAKKLHAKHRFDVVHHVTFVTYWKPSLLCLLPPPFVWGPVGGADRTPAPFLKTLSFRGKLYELLRNAALSLGELDPLVRLTARKAALALPCTAQTRRRLVRLGARSVHEPVQLALSAAEIARLRANSPPPPPFRFVSVGRLIPLKGLHIALSAFAAAQADLPQAQYWIIGDGPERKRLEALCDELHIAQKVKFWGRVPRDKVLELLPQCHALVHPSFHESSPTVSLEAMAAGLPVICFDIAGLSLQVTEQTGFKITPTTPDQAVRDFARAMVALAGDHARLRQMSEAARRRVAECFSWEARGRFAAELYRKLTEQCTR